MLQPNGAGGPRVRHVSSSALPGFLQDWNYRRQQCSLQGVQAAGSPATSGMSQQLSNLNLYYQPLKFRTCLFRPSSAAQCLQGSNVLSLAPPALLQDRQLEEASQTAAAASSERELQEAQQREQTLAAALEEARASLTNMQRLHQASQNQLFSIQVRSTALTGPIHQGPPG